jgi:hypothetical protein
MEYRVEIRSAGEKGPSGLLSMTVVGECAYENIPAWLLA